MGDLKEKANQLPKIYKPSKWITNIENKINNVRKTIGQLITVINSKKNDRFTKHQKNCERTLGRNIVKPKEELLISN